MIPLYRITLYDPKDTMRCHKCNVDIMDLVVCYTHGDRWGRVYCSTHIPIEPPIFAEIQTICPHSNELIEHIYVYYISDHKLLKYVPDECVIEIYKEFVLVKI